MIFVSLGTQIYQFDRLTEELDRIVENGTVTEPIFAQIGTATYFPRHYEYKQFLSKEEFEKYQSDAVLIISHGGTGALIGASKKGKNIIAVPRLAEYGEHTDDHQMQIVSVLEKEGYVRAVYNISDLENTILEAMRNPITKKYNRESNVMGIIEGFISESSGVKNEVVRS